MPDTGILIKSIHETAQNHSPEIPSVREMTLSASQDLDTLFETIVDTQEILGVCEEATRTGGELEEDQDVMLESYDSVRLLLQSIATNHYELIRSMNEEFVVTTCTRERRDDIQNDFILIEDRKRDFVFLIEKDSSNVVVIRPAHHNHGKGFRSEKFLSVCSQAEDMRCALHAALDEEFGNVKYISVIGIEEGPFIRTVWNRYVDYREEDRDLLRGKDAPKGEPDVIGKSLEMAKYLQEILINAAQNHHVRTQFADLREFFDWDNDRAFPVFLNSMIRALEAILAGKQRYPSESHLEIRLLPRKMVFNNNRLPAFPSNTRRRPIVEPPTTPRLGIVQRGHHIIFEDHKNKILAIAGEGGEVLGLFKYYDTEDIQRILDILKVQTIGGYTTLQLYNDICSGKTQLRGYVFEMRKGGLAGKRNVAEKDTRSAWKRVLPQDVKPASVREDIIL